MCSPGLPGGWAGVRIGPMSPKPKTPGASKPQVRKTPPAQNPAERTTTEEHEGATDAQVGDTTGPGAGYDQEPVQERDKGGVS